jgi:two-component system NarL family sensor kinase
MPEKTVKEGKILIVDDEKANVRLLEIILQRAGYVNVYSTTDARQALPLFLSHLPDLLILDLAMPHTDGFAVMRVLQAEPTTASVPILVLTADARPAGKHKALKEGAADFLTKPLDEVEVLLRIYNLLQTRFHRVVLEEKVREAQLFLQSTFDALSSHVAVLDEAGTILAVNRAWRTFFAKNGGSDASCGVGTNYIGVCERASDCSEATEVSQGIRAVMDGVCQDFNLEYPCQGAEEQFWFIIHVTHFEVEGSRRVVVAHENITQRKQAEEQVRRLGEQRELDLGLQRLLTHRFISTLEEERRAISFELHDGLTQYVMSSFAFFESYAATLDPPDAPLPVDLQKGMKYLQEAVVEARRMVNGLRSLALDELGLVGALEQLIIEEQERAHWQEAPLIVSAPIPRFDTVLETAAYRVVQEALTNIRKHAEARRVLVRLQVSSEGEGGVARLQVEVRDWGKGFTVEEKREDYDHVGLHSMEERVNLLRGTILIESHPGEGTRVYAEFPIDDRPGVY